MDGEPLAAADLLLRHVLAAIPGSGGGEGPERLGGGPIAVVIKRRVPQRQRVQFGFPTGVGRERPPIAPLFFDGDSGDERRRLARFVGDLDRDQVGAADQVLRDIELDQLLGRFAGADPAAVEVQLVIVVGGDRNLARFRRLQRERLAEVADFARRHVVFGVFRRPDPLGVLRGQRRGQQQGESDYAAGSDPSVHGNPQSVEHRGRGFLTSPAHAADARAFRRRF